MRDVSEESLLDYFHSTAGNSGRVRNADILKTFKPFIGHSDLQLRAKYREEFKLIIDRIAVVKSENVSELLRFFFRFFFLPFVGKALLPWSYMSHVYTKQSVKPSTENVVFGPEFGFHSLFWSLEFFLLTVDMKQQLKLTDDVTRLSELDFGFEATAGCVLVFQLDPTEKEWIYSAASARVPELLKLLVQDPSLANKKVTALHWAAKHGNEDMMTLVADAGADVNLKSGYTPLHIAALHGHQHILDLLIKTYGAKENLRDYSGHLACYYLNIKDPEGPGDDRELQFQVTQVRERNKNRKLVSLFHSKKKWGSAEELAPIEEERTAPHQLLLPAFRPRKFSR
uniref:SOWAHA-C winged helix-turn-helix domain-containing protein n=1 Tax=Oryzias sinensis TaxID=183150 RepID=A0A8C8E0I2_9TELE